MKQTNILECEQIKRHNWMNEPNGLSHLQSCLFTGVSPCLCMFSYNRLHRMWWNYESEGSRFDSWQVHHFYLLITSKLKK